MLEFYNIQLKDICSESSHGRDVSSASSILGSPTPPTLLLLEAAAALGLARRLQAAAAFTTARKKHRGANLRSSHAPPLTRGPRGLQVPDATGPISLTSGEVP